VNAETAVAAGPLALLRQPFPAHHISKLPKPTKKQTDDVKADFKKGIRCAICGAWHHPDVVHLDYVGHAALTDRLLDADPEWSWEPVGFTPEGLPARDQNGGLWIKLTVCGVTRYGYGAADGKTGGDAVKEIIGDALRNAAMRFGAALDLWHKGDLHPDDAMETHDTETGEIIDAKPVSPPREKLEGPYPAMTTLKAAIKAFAESLRIYNDDAAGFNAWMETPEVIELEQAAMRYIPQWWDTGEGMPAEYEPMTSRIERKRRELEELDSIANSPGAKRVRAG